MTSRVSHNTSVFDNRQSARHFSFVFSGGLFHMWYTKCTRLYFVVNLSDVVRHAHCKCAWRIAQLYYGEWCTFALCGAVCQIIYSPVCYTHICTLGWNSLLPRPRGLTFMWWGCYSLCPWHKPAELARSFFFFFLSLCLFLSLRPFQLYFIP